MTRTKPGTHGDGAVYQRASDGRWIATIEAGVTARGTRRRITLSAKTEGEVRKKLTRKRAEIERDGAPVEGVSARATVGSWAPVWLAERQQHVAPKTYNDYATYTNRWIVPTIGRRKLADLTPTDVRAITAAITKAGRTTTTARGAQRALFQMLKAAQLEGHNVPARVLLVRAPAQAVNDRDAIPLDDARRLLAVATQRPDGSRWVAALLQGLRQGECLGLTWENIDLDAGTLVVSWQLQAFPHRHGCGTPDRDGAYPCGFRRTAYCPERRPNIPGGMEVRHLVDTLYLKRPKSKAGLRVQPLVPWMTAALTEWRKVAPANPWGLVWPAERTGVGASTTARTLPQTSADDRASWVALQDEAVVRHSSGRHYVLHEARHTAATLLLEGGVPDHVITAILGHSSIVTSRGYMHASQTLARQALDAVATRLDLTPSTPAQITT